MRHKLSSAILGITLIGLVVLTACGTDSDTTSNSPSYTIGILDPAGLVTPVEGFKTGMADFIKDGTITYIEPEGDMTLIAISIGAVSNADLVLCVNTPACSAIQAAFSSSQTPIVFVAVDDPIATRFIESLPQPGGFMTGIASSPPNQLSVLKGFEWLLETDPTIERVYVPHNPTDRETQAKLEALQEVARQTGIELVTQAIRTPDDAVGAIANIPADVDAIFTFSEQVWTKTTIQELAEAAMTRGLPYCAPTNGTDALLTYTSDHYAMGTQAARLAAQILQGTAAGDLPSEISDFFLTVNLGTADALGLEVPLHVLNAADTIIYAETQ